MEVLKLLLHLIIVLPQALNHINIILRVKCDKHCLKQNEVSFSHRQIVNLWSYTQGANFTLTNS